MLLRYVCYKGRFIVNASVRIRVPEATHRYASAAIMRRCVAKCVVLVFDTRRADARNTMHCRWGRHCKYCTLIQVYCVYRRRRTVYGLNTGRRGKIMRTYTYSSTFIRSTLLFSCHCDLNIMRPDSTNITRLYYPLLCERCIAYTHRPSLFRL